jgi:colanic acid/amylovoran biosynthesis protein
MNEKAFSVCLLGCSFDTGNRGVSALAASLIKCFLTARPDARIWFFIGTRTPAPQSCVVNGETRKFGVINFRLSLKSRPRDHLAWMFLAALFFRLCPVPRVRRGILRRNRALSSLAEADIIGDIRGGDSFSDIYGLWRFLAGTVPVFIVLLLGKNLVLLPQTYGPYSNPIARKVARSVVGRASRVLSRDRAGLQTIAGLLGPAAEKSGRVRFCPDVAFHLEPRRPSALETIPPLPEARGSATLVGINVNGLVFNGGYTRKNMFGLTLDYRAYITGLIRALLAEDGNRVLLVPHTYGAPGGVNSDPDAARGAARDLAGVPGADRLYVVEREYDQHEVKAVIGMCGFFVGSRMHACIAAASQGIPTVAVAYSKKFAGVFESIGMGDMVIDARETGTETALRTTLERFRSRERAREALAASIPEVKRMVGETFRWLVSPDA